MLARGGGGGGGEGGHQKYFSGHIKYSSTIIRKFCRTYQNIFPNIASFSQRYNNFFQNISKFFRNVYVLPECRIDFCPTVNILGGHLHPPRAPLQPIRLSVVAITESWLNHEVINQLVVINGYNIFLKDRTHGRDGGVCAFVSADISFKRRQDIENSAFECIRAWLIQSRRHGLETPNVLRVPSVMRLRHACACAILNRLLLPKSKTNKRLMLMYCLLFLYSTLYRKIV